MKSGTLSTLRQGIGSLLSDDLIIPDTETKVNNFLRNHLKVYWIEYPNNMQLIDNDEDILIKGLKPLLYYISELLNEADDELITYAPEIDINIIEEKQFSCQSERQNY